MNGYMLEWEDEIVLGAGLTKVKVIVVEIEKLVWSLALVFFDMYMDTELHWLIAGIDRKVADPDLDLLTYFLIFQAAFIRFKTITFFFRT